MAGYAQGDSDAYDKFRASKTIQALALPEQITKDNLSSFLLNHRIYDAGREQGRKEDLEDIIQNNPEILENILTSLNMYLDYLKDDNYQNEFNQKLVG